MARVKPKNTITNRTQAETAMSRLSQIDRQSADWDIKEANAVAVVREQFAAIRKDNRCALLVERTLLIKELQTWAEADSATWGRKTLETPFGKLGFRVSQPAVVLVKKAARSFKAALELLQTRLPEFVRTVAEIDKEAILAAERADPPGFDATALRECGLDIKQDDEFWVESNAAKDLEEAVKKLKAA